MNWRTDLFPKRERSHTRSSHRRGTGLVGGVLVVLATGCGGVPQDGPDSAGSPYAAPPVAAPTVGAPAAATAAQTPLVALGDSIFHGQAAGGTCVSCHGPKGAGGSIGPNLTDATWLNGDGSAESIAKIVTAGVPKPVQGLTPMPPMGGASLSPDQVRAVAAYVASLGATRG